MNQRQLLLRWLFILLILIIYVIIIIMAPFPKGILKLSYLFFPISIFSVFLLPLLFLLLSIRSLKVKHNASEIHVRTAALMALIGDILWMTSLLVEGRMIWGKWYFERRAYYALFSIILWIAYFFLFRFLATRSIRRRIVIGLIATFPITLIALGGIIFVLINPTTFILNFQSTPEEQSFSIIPFITIQYLILLGFLCAVAWSPINNWQIARQKSV